jgi:hypothetical protein
MYITYILRVNREREMNLNISLIFINSCIFSTLTPDIPKIIISSSYMKSILENICK